MDRSQFEELPEASPSRRAAMTKRSRTRQQILAALEELLATRTYDQIRVADISSRASVGVATFYTVFGDKAGAVAELFMSRYEPLEQQALTDIEDGVPSDLLLGAHFFRLADVVHRHRTVARGFLRVYGSEVLAKSDDIYESVRRIFDISQRLIESMAQLNRDQRLVVGELGTLWTIDLFTALLTHPPDFYLTITENLLLTFLPEVDVDTAERLSGVVPTIHKE